jgi:hypothetical protein
MQNSIDSVTAQDLVDIIKAQLQRYYTDINIIYSFTDSNYICELFLMQVSMIFYIFTNLQFMIYLKISEIIMIPGQFVICYPTSDCNPLIFMDDFFSFFLDFIHDSHHGLSLPRFSLLFHPLNLHFYISLRGLHSFFGFSYYRKL